MADRCHRSPAPSREQLIGSHTDENKDDASHRGAPFFCVYGQWTAPMPWIERIPNPKKSKNGKLSFISSFSRSNVLHELKLIENQFWFCGQCHTDKKISQLHFGDAVARRVLLSALYFCSLSSETREKPFSTNLKVLSFSDNSYKH